LGELVMSINRDYWRELLIKPIDLNGLPI